MIGFAGASPFKCDRNPVANSSPMIYATAVEKGYRLELVYPLGKI